MVLKRLQERFAVMIGLGLNFNIYMQAYQFLTNIFVGSYFR